ncbi:MAG: tetratricopeptide repeat protein, partial [Chthoniobacterales bacterium]
MRADGNWSGYERNVFYANNRDGTFSDVSAAVGLDFIEDGRSFALADFDHDGRQEVFLKSRNAPQLRVLKNVVRDLPPSIAFRLRGTTSNRDAIGAAVTIETSAGKQTRMLQAGSGFLSQHSKEIFFGLGEAKGTVDATIRWPSGLLQEAKNLPINHRVWVEEGLQTVKFEAFRPVAQPSAVTSNLSADRERLPTRVETWLLAPVPARDFSLPDLSGKTRALVEFKGKTVLLNFWTAKSEECQADLASLEKYYSRWLSSGIQTLCINADNVPVNSNQGKTDQIDLDAFMRGRRFSFPILRGSEDVAAVYNILFRQLFDRHRDLSLPTSFLIDGEGSIVKVYQGRIDPEHVDQDLSRIPRTDTERLARALPFPSKQYTLQFGRNHLSTGSLFYQRGYLEQAEVSFQQALRDDPSNAEALYGIGSVYLNQNKNAAAREMFERCVKVQSNYPETIPDAWNNLGVLATREHRIDEAINDFQQALSVNPRHILSLNNLGNAYRLQKRWDDARKVLERAIEVAPDDPEANYGLGMVFAQTSDTDKASEFLQRALKARPTYPEALNNLGILYVVTHRHDEAVSSFEKCIQVAPAFDQAYLNLARI